ncbi:MAG: flagellar motor protein MotB [Paracoccaceae bacterium]
MSAGSNAPVIIKRKKVVSGDGHHGGAWKVAYADFVTAMMAFFMLMWLLNATTEKQRKGIADYFNPTIPVNRISGGGEGAFGGDSIFSEKMLAQSGTGATARRTTNERQARGATGVDLSERRRKSGENAAAFKEVEKLLLARSGESMVDDRAMRHIVTRVTDKGLIVELFDMPGSPLFESRGDTPSPMMAALTRMIAGVFRLVTNEVAIGGHTRALPQVRLGGSPWDLSTRRAQAARAMLEDSGLAAQRVRRVTGHADRSPAVDDPMAVRNNRIELILLRVDRPNR